MEKELDRPRKKQGIARYDADFEALPAHQDIDPIRILVGDPEELPVMSRPTGYQPPLLRTESYEVTADWYDSTDV